MKLLSVAATTISTLRTQNFPRDGNSSVGRASDRKARRNTDMGSTAQCDKGFFSQSQVPVQTLLRCPYSPRVQLAYINNCAQVKNPEEWQPYNSSVWTQENTTHTDRKRIVLILRMLCLTQLRWSVFPTRDKEDLGGSSTDYGQSDRNLLHL